MLRPSFKRAPNLIASAAMLAVISASAIALLLMKARSDAIDDASVNAGNLASVLAEQAEHAMDAMDGSLRTTVRLVARWDRAEFEAHVRGDRFLADLKNERTDLRHAQLIAITDAAGNVIAGSRGPDAVRVEIGDRDYFRRLRDEPALDRIVTGPLVSRLDGSTMIFIARRLLSAKGEFLGVTFIGVKPSTLLETSFPLRMISGQSFGLFTAQGGLLLRSPEPVTNSEVGTPIPASSPWHATVAAGGGAYRSDGYFDPDPKYVAVRPLRTYPLIASVAITENAALATWKSRAIIVVVVAAALMALISGLAYAQLVLRTRLDRARLRSWLRAKRLAAKSAQLSNVNKQFSLTLDYMAHGMAIFDADGRLVVSNPCYAELYGLQAERMRVGMSVHEVFDARVAHGVYAGDPETYRALAGAPPRPSRIDYLNNGHIILVRTRRMDDGGWATMQEDVTERFKSTERLAHMALHDGLTDLPNRAGFRKRLDEEIFRGGDDRLILLIADIDGFKMVNDSYGHDVGDQVLVEFAARVKAAVPTAFLARLGGDEFVIMTSKPECTEACLNELSTRLLQAVKAPMSIAGRHIALGMSIGAVTVPLREAEGARLLRRADLALLEAKKRGRGCCCVFNEAMERQFDRRAALGEQLRAAIDEDQLELHYQPIVDAADRSIICMEALVRWRHPVDGMIPPAMFVPLAEEMGLIGALGRWVMRRACADAARWPAGIAVAVNVSSLQIAQPDFLSQVQEVLAESGLPAPRLQIEITESVLLQNDAQSIACLHALHELGVSFALDDFGTGYASLAYLKTFPLDKVKIDKSFVDDICTDPQSIAIVGAVVALARGLGIVTTAEGVETQAQLDALRALGVATLQGYFCGRPKPICEQNLEDARTAA